MNITSQQTQVGHEFEQIRERQIEATFNFQSLGATAKETLSAESSITDEANEGYLVSLTPEQIVKQKLIESINQNSPPTKVLTPEQLVFHSQYAGKINNELSLSFQQIITSENLLSTPDDSTLLSVKESIYQYERLDYSTSVNISTESEENQELSLSLTFSRELSIERNLLLSAAQLKDPLLINLNGKAELFLENDLHFDLDGNGSKEAIPELNSGVWYLAYDRNDNGIIDNGLELFGPRTGNGFTELQAFNSDQNNLIDKRDSDFNKLQLWDGKNQLKPISDSGIAAIMLLAENTPFTFTNNAGNPRAQLRQTSVFITDQQKLGTIHQIDIVV